MRFCKRGNIIHDCIQYNNFNLKKIPSTNCQKVYILNVLATFNDLSSWAFFNQTCIAKDQRSYPKFKQSIQVG